MKWSLGEANTVRTAKVGRFSRTNSGKTVWVSHLRSKPRFATERPHEHAREPRVKPYSGDLRTPDDQMETAHAFLDFDLFQFPGHPPIL